MCTRILLPVDGSENSRRTVAVAAELAQVFEAEIVVFHAAEWEPGALGPRAKEPAMAAPDFAEAIADELTTQGIHAAPETQTARKGQVAAQMVDAVRRREANLIVMGSPVLSPLRSAFLGSVTNVILQHAECPVFVIR